MKDEEIEVQGENEFSLGHTASSEARDPSPRVFDSKTPV